MIKISKKIYTKLLTHPAGMKKAIEMIIGEMYDAKEYGSILKITPQDLTIINARFNEIHNDTNMFKDAALSELYPLLQVVNVLVGKYDVVVTNPPYMGSGGMSGKLSKYVKDNYPNSKSDLFAVCLDKGNQMVKSNGYNSMVTMQSWMFLSSFEEMRKTILTSKMITTLMHMENMVIGIAFGTAVSVIRNCSIRGFKGTFNQVKMSDISNERPVKFPNYPCVLA